MHTTSLRRWRLADTMARNAPQIRDSIKSLFPDRDCYTLVRPMHDERALNHLDALDTSQLRPEFSQVQPGHSSARRTWYPAAQSGVARDSRSAAQLLL